MSSDSIFRPMAPGDVQAALAIIADHDEDDFEGAQVTYASSLQGQYALEVNSRIVGVTGAKPIEGTDRAYAISWTYLARDFIGRGYGRTMLQNMLDQIRSERGRKVFVSTSDYIDPEDGDIYRDAREAYRAVGFVEEMRHRDYYDLGESEVVYGMRIDGHEPANGRAMNEQKVRLTDIDEIPECDGAYWLAWELDNKGTDTDHFNLIVDQVKEWEGRVIFMAFPSDLLHAGDFMSRCRFRADGQLADYFEDGVDENHYRYDLSTFGP